MPSVDAVVVDTHAVIWWQAGGERLSRAAARRLGRADDVYLSPISCWEIAMLVAKGRVLLDRPVGAWVNDLFATGAAKVADLTPTIAVAAAELADFHGDPADRIIYATAASRGLPLVTKDAKLRELAKGRADVQVLW